MRARARKDPEGSTIVALRLAELAVPLQELRDIIAAGARRAAAVLAGADDAMLGMPLAIASNALKVGSSTRALDVVHRAMMLCGIDGYRTGPTSLGRHVADIYGGLIMVNNDRLLAGNSELLKVLKTF
jgi:acyl-CoA dehydrogenase